MTVSKVSLVRTASPPMTIGASICSDCICWRRRRSSSRSGVPGAYDLTGSFSGIGGGDRAGGGGNRGGCRGWHPGRGGGPPPRPKGGGGGGGGPGGGPRLGRASAAP